MDRILAALACMALVGCVESPVPLESGAKVSDPALIGLWKTDLHGDPMIATIRQEKDGRMVADVQGYFEPGPKAATEQYEFVLAHFGEQRYMSIRYVKESPKYRLARYVLVNKDRFCVYGGYSDALLADLEQKILPGAVIPDRHISNVGLTASSEQLRDYFSKHGAKAFHTEDEAAMVFQRVTSDVLPPPKGPPDDPDAVKATPCRP